MARSTGTYAIFNTSEGEIVCRLFEADAPKTVANFLELAEGKREWTHPVGGKKSNNKLYDGTGLGLNICKKLTEMMHGTLSATSELKQGTTFYLSLPLKRANQIEKAKKEKTIDELAGHKVEKNFELFKSPFIVYAKGMKPETIDKPASSLDIIPTISNLLGLEFDSRLLKGEQP